MAKLKNAVRVFREHRKKLKVDKTSLHKFVRGKDKNLKGKKKQIAKRHSINYVKIFGYEIYERRSMGGHKSIGKKVK